MHRHPRSFYQGITILLSALLVTLFACSPDTANDEQDNPSQTPASSLSPFDNVNDILLPTEDAVVALSPSATEKSLESCLTPYGGSVCIAYRNLGSGSLKDFSINGSSERTAASMIKLVILAEAFDQVSCGDLSLDTLKTIRQSDVVGGTGILQFSGVGTVVTIEELARLMIAESDNTATNMLIDIVGMDAVNEEAANLGLVHTKLQRKMLDNAAAEQGLENIMSADDVASILTLIYYGVFYNADLSALALSFLEQQSDSSGIPTALPTGTVFAHKTGTLSYVQNDGGIVLAENPYVLVVMTEGIDNSEALSLMAKITMLVEEARDEAVT